MADRSSDKAVTTEAPERPRSASSKVTPSRDVGQYLRDAYRGALDEGVPDDMMDLLRKLD